MLQVRLGVGVHLTLFRSFSLALPPLPSHPAIRPMASALLAAAVPMVVLSNNLFAAGVKLPGTSALREVHEGGGIGPPPILPVPTCVLETPGVFGPSPSNPAFPRRLFDALLDSLFEMTSRDDGAGRWKGVLGVRIGSPDCDRMRGVALSVPQVMSCLIAVGPSSEGVGEGRSGTNEKLLIVGDLGRSIRDY